MKFITYGKTLYSLENVKTITVDDGYRHKHTSNGEPYFLYGKTFTISYFGGDNATIFVDNFTSEQKCDQAAQALFNQIQTVLSGD